MIRPHVERFANGTASIEPTLPKNAGGKQLKLQVRIGFNGQTVRRTGSFRIH